MYIYIYVFIHRLYIPTDKAHRRGEPALPRHRGRGAQVEGGPPPPTENNINYIEHINAYYDWIVLIA